MTNLLFFPQKRVASVVHISFPVFQNNSTDTGKVFLSNIQDEKAILKPLGITSSHCSTQCYIVLSYNILNQKAGRQSLSYILISF